jgi:putative DNA primase/helicase
MSDDNEGKEGAAVKPSSVVTFDPKRKRKPKAERQPSGDWKDRLVYRGEKIDGCSANVATILANDPAWSGLVAFDEFAQAIVTTRPPPWDFDDAPTDIRAGDFSDADAVRLQAWLARHYSLKVGKDLVWDAALVAAERTIVNGPRDWLESLRWDGTRRVHTWLSTYAGAIPTANAHNVGQWFLVSAVARVYAPGCKVDTMPIFEGPQGLLKSTLLRELFGATWFGDTPLELGSKDRFVALRRKWCIEIAELDSFSRPETSRIKSFLSSPVDDYRPPYGRANIGVPRRCVFCGTVNESAYLKDDTGNRRFWPVRCRIIDIDALRRDREQIWAEARELYQSGAKWWPSTDEEIRACTAEQTKRTVPDAWQPAIETWTRQNIEGAGYVTVGDVLDGALKIEKARWDQPAQNRVARCLRAILNDDEQPWLERHQLRAADKSRLWAYRPRVAETAAETEAG